MPSPILHLGATVQCSHTGPATPTMPSARVTLAGQALVTLSSPYAIVGCALSGTSSPPCATGQFISGATRVTAGGAPVATLTGQSTCVPTGTPMLAVNAQTRVLAS